MTLILLKRSDLFCGVRLAVTTIVSVSSVFFSTVSANTKPDVNVLAMVRATIEVMVVFFGWLLGGTAGLGTIIFALGIGPAVAIGIYFVSKNFK